MRRTKHFLIQSVSRHDLDPSCRHRSQLAHLNESRHQKAARRSESQRDQSEPAAMTTTTKTLEQSSEQLMEKIVDPDNLVPGTKSDRPDEDVLFSSRGAWVMGDVGEPNSA